MIHELFTIAWIVWVVLFPIIEGLAIYHDHKDVGGPWVDTLSEHLRRWFHTDTHLGRTVWLIFSVILFVAFLIPHIATAAGVWF